MVTLSLLFTLLVGHQPVDTARQDPPVQASLSVAPTPVNKKLLLRLINDVRKKGCSCGGTWFGPASPLAWNDALEKAAAAHSKDMKEHRFFSHVNTEGDDAGTRLSNAGYAWKTYGENIGMGYPTEKDVIDGWLHSAGHCRNIMNKTFQEMGVAREGDYWTQDFGTRK
jgi:uncharacterized protein YkwD